MLDAPLLALCLTLYDLASVNAGLAGLEAQEAAFEARVDQVSGVLSILVGPDPAGAQPLMHDALRRVLAMTGADFAAEIARCDTALGAAP